MKLTKQQINDILDLIWDWSDYEIEGNKIYGYDITPSLDKNMYKKIGKELSKIITPKPWWKKYYK